jgi:sugar/nucleoside kinase (ribokinase family)
MESHSESYDVVIIGNYTKDTIVSPSGTRYVDGGGFNYGAYVAAMMGLKTAAVTRLAKEDSHVVDALVKLGVDVYPVFTPQSTLMRLYYPTTNVDERTLSVNGTAGAFTPDQVENLNARVFLINASTRGEVPLEVIKVLRSKKTMVAADVQGFVRIIAPDGTLVYDSWEGKEQILPLIDVLKSDSVEAEILTKETDVRVQAQKLADMGPKEIVLTHRNGVLVYADGQFHEAVFQPRELIGRSGRGDTCIASYMCRRLSAVPAESMIWAAAVTSLKMEAEGPIERKVEEVEDLIRRAYSGS